MKQFIFWAMAARGQGISGSDRIFIELAKRWSQKDLLKMMVWTEGYQMCQRSELSGPQLEYRVASLWPWNKGGFLISYIGQIIEGIRLGLVTRAKNDREVVSYSASDFWMDVFPAVILKLRYPKTRWLASWYQTAPSPVQGFGAGRQKAYRWSAFWYWFVQLPVKPLISWLADVVIVNNEDERRRFPKLDQKGRVFVMIGAVDLDRIDQYLDYHLKVSKLDQVVFQGRFHPQKGVVELISIWGLVTAMKPKAKLVMIGDGPLKSEVKAEIKRSKLTNIELLGYVLDGDLKYQTFNQSKLVVHPAYYDSGGMAAAEAMAFGLPMVAFDLKAYDSYYPAGLVKAPIGDLVAFANLIVKLLDNQTLQKKLGQQAKKMIYQDYSWNVRSAQLYQLITNEN